MKRLGYFLLVTVLACDQSETHRTWADQDRQVLVEGLHLSCKNVATIVANLDSVQWFWRSDSVAWSIAEVVEHLIVHDELFYREVQVLTALPEMPPLDQRFFAPDEVILGYRLITPDNIGRSPTYLEPQGRWCSRDDALRAYARSRAALVGIVSQTEKNLRSYYTKSGRGPTTYRDLHQLMLISIAHTDRHASQIERIKEHLLFPG